MTIYFRVLRCNVHMDKISLHQKTFAANVSFVYFCNARECNRTGEIGQFWRCYTPFLVCCAGWTKHLAGLPRSVRGKYAEQPGLLSVNALKHTLNSGPVLHSKLKARRSVLTIRREAFFILHLCFIFFFFCAFFCLSPHEEELANVAECHLFLISFTEIVHGA